jgi:restriction endonuclease S subunit
MNNNGNIPFYSCKSVNPIGFHDKYSFDYDENYLLLITSGGSMNNIIGDNVGLGKCYLVNGKTSCRAGVCCLKLKNDNIDIRYIYQYLNINRLETNKKAKFTTNLGVISSDDIKSIKIPIPPLERQIEIVEYLDFLYEKANKTSNEKIAELKQLNMYCLKNQKIFGENVVKTLGEVCEVNQGNSLTKIEMIDGIYDVIGGGKIIGKHNKKNRDGNDFTLTRVGDININYIDKPYYLTDNGFSLKSNQEDIMTKYIYYLLSHNKDYLINLYQGVGQKVISKTNLKSIKIPIPPLERQMEIVEYCDFNEELIKQLEKEIDNNKKQARLCINSISKSLSTDNKEINEIIEEDE